jgi:hypothetical protein
MLVLSLALCCAAVFIDRFARNDVMAQFALAISMAGQAFFGFGLGHVLHRYDVGLASGMIVLQVILFAAMKSPLHRVWSVAVAAACLYFVLHKSGIAGAAAGVMAVAFASIWACEDAWRASPTMTPPRRRTPDFSSFLGPLGWGLALALVAWAAPSFFERPGHAIRVLETAGYGAGLVVYAGIASSRAGMKARVLALLGAGLLAVVAHPAPGIVAGTLVLVAGHGSRQRTVAALGVAGILGYLAAYYYQLDQTLLAKAGALAATGLALLLAAFVVRCTQGAPR